MDLCACRRKSVPKREADPLAPSFLEKDDSAATALLSLGSGIQPSAEAPVGPPRRIIVGHIKCHMPTLAALSSY